MSAEEAPTYAETIGYKKSQACSKCGGTTFDNLGCRRCQSMQADNVVAEKAKEKKVNKVKT